MICASTEGVPVTDQDSVVLCIVQSKTVTTLFLSLTDVIECIHALHVCMYMCNMNIIHATHEYEPGN